MIYTFDKTNNPPLHALSLYTTNFEVLHTKVSISHDKDKRPIKNIDLLTVKLGITSRYAIRVNAKYVPESKIYGINLQLTFNGRVIKEVFVTSITIGEIYDITLRNSLNDIVCIVSGDRTFGNFINLPKSYFVARSYKPFVKEIANDEMLTVDITSIFQSNETNASFNI